MSQHCVPFIKQYADLVVIVWFHHQFGGILLSIVLPRDVRLVANITFRMAHFDFNALSSGLVAHKRTLIAFFATIGAACVAITSIASVTLTAIALANT